MLDTYLYYVEFFPGDGNVYEKLIKLSFNPNEILVLKDFRPPSDKIVIRHIKFGSIEYERLVYRINNNLLYSNKDFFLWQTLDQSPSFKKFRKFKLL